MDDASDADDHPRNGVIDVHSLVLTSTSSVTSSPTSSSLKTEESSTSFFADRSSTLGSLIGIAGDSILGDNDHILIGATSNRILPIDFCQDSLESQSVSCKDESCAGLGPKLCGFFQCVACKGLCSSYGDTCKVWSRVTKKRNTHVRLHGPSVNSASLGHLLIAERDAEKSLERGFNGPKYGSQLFVDIMYNRNAGLEEGTHKHHFDTNASCSSQVSNDWTKKDQTLEQFCQRPGLSRELGFLLSSCLDDDAPPSKRTNMVMLSTPTP